MVAYLLGHSDWELERLATQARMINPFTRRFYERAGIGSGMRVLDVGSGAGDTALLLAEIVGPSGSVTGIDRSSEALATAQRRLAERAIANVRFVQSELDQASFETPFDAIAGRYVLMFQPDPVAVLRALARHARPGAPVVFHEPDWDGAHSRPAAALYDQCCRWIVEACHKTGADDQMGGKLHRSFRAAGLPDPEMGNETLVGGGPGAEDAVRLVTDIVRTILPEMERHGIATAKEVAIETLHERAMAEVIGISSFVVGRYEVGAWCRIP